MSRSVSAETVNEELVGEKEANEKAAITQTSLRGSKDFVVACRALATGAWRDWSGKDRRAFQRE